MTNTDTVLCRTTLSILFSTDLINTQVDLLSAALPLLKTSAFITFGPVYVNSTLYNIYILFLWQWRHRWHHSLSSSGHWRRVVALVPNSLIKVGNWNTAVTSASEKHRSLCFLTCKFTFCSRNRFNTYLCPPRGGWGVYDVWRRLFIMEQSGL